MTQEYQSLNPASMKLITESGLDRGFEVEEGRDYGAGPIDVVWRIPVYPGLPEIKCGFVALQSAEGGDRDIEDNQFSLRKIEWLASHGSLLRLDAISLGLFPKQKGPSVIVPSQKRVPKGAKIRKQAMRKREAKLDKYNRPKRKKNPIKETVRESRIDRNSRPRGQMPKRRKDQA